MTVGKGEVCVGWGIEKLTSDAASAHLDIK